MRRCYVAGPYRAPTTNGVYHNVHRARVVAERLWAKGYAVFCPHMNSAFLNGVCPDEHFLEGDLEWLRCAEMIVMLDGWRSSAGAVAEYALACKLGLEIVHERDLDAL
jgi:hypothetical protein